MSTTKSSKFLKKHNFYGSERKAKDFVLKSSYGDQINEKYVLSHPLSHKEPPKNLFYDEQVEWLKKCKGPRKENFSCAKVSPFIQTINAFPEVPL